MALIHPLSAFCGLGGFEVSYVASDLPYVYRTKDDIQQEADEIEKSYMSADERGEADQWMNKQNL